MKTLPLLLLALSQAVSPPKGGKYTIVVEGYDWGAGVSKVVLSLDEKVSKADASRYAVSVKRSTPCVEIPADQAAGERVVIDAYVSDARGQRADEGTNVTLVLAVAPQWPISSPLHYVRNEKCRGNQWVDYAVTVTEKASGRVWNEAAGRISPIVDRFDLSGTFEREGVKLTYAHFAPAAAGRKAPLIIWLHGGGEGGTDPTIPLLANKATSYASEEIQAIFGGAHVLVPQTPGAWMQNRAGEMTGGREDDIYNVALPDGVADGVVIHQVLHYLSEPAHAVREAARVLAPGGRLLIVDFAPHEIEDLRERHAHERLGFEADQVTAWLKEAGLTGIGYAFNFAKRQAAAVHLLVVDLAETLIGKPVEDSGHLGHALHVFVDHEEGPGRALGREHVGERGQGAFREADPNR